ncbi:MAG: type III-B CRISPR module RAMP protein Cmr6 [Zoogloeaceae bacterium]|nr:type III-B CRISPR module RAMP protein Cmr6 [Zoogloeaceae bacterium]
MVTAIPAYLGTRFDDCPPGHRFGLYFDAWEPDWRKPSNKSPAFESVANAFPQHSKDALAAICARQQEQAAALGQQVFSHPARLFAPLATGLGNEHPLENGFAFLNPHGLPYLAGSGLKGVLRRAAEELAGGEWGDCAGWDQPVIDALFGPGEEDPLRDEQARRGALVFWDLFFLPAKGKSLLAVEIMTPHHRDYLQSNGTPHANEQPNPIPFLAVAAGATCTLHIELRPAYIPPQLAGLADKWRALLGAAVEHAGEWLGFGAKTAVGYGRLGQDKAILKQAADDARDRAEAEQRKAYQAELDKLTPQGRSVKEFVTACESKLAQDRKDPFTPGSGLYAEALRLSKIALADDGSWSSADRLQLAEALATWLPQVIDRYDAKDARKKLKLAALRGEA